jgi:hypothetical protein
MGCAGRKPPDSLPCGAERRVHAANETRLQLPVATGRFVAAGPSVFRGWALQLTLAPLSNRSFDPFSPGGSRQVVEIR